MKKSSEEIARYEIKPEGLGEINIDKEKNGEWVRYEDMQAHPTATLDTLKERVEGLKADCDVRYNLALTEVLQLIEEVSDE